jgi:integrase
MRELDPTWEHRTFHDLRHTYASLLITAGEHPKVIQEAMGHSSIRVTLDIYGHLMDGMTASARTAIDSFGPPLSVVAEAV